MEARSEVTARPVFDKLMTDARAGRVRVVAVVAVDRLGRSMAGVINTVRELDRAGCGVVSLRAAKVAGVGEATLRRHLGGLETRRSAEGGEAPRPAAPSPPVRQNPRRRAASAGHVGSNADRPHLHGFSTLPCSALFVLPILPV